MKKLVCFILILFSCLANSQEQTNNIHAKPQSEFEYALWFNQLNQHLLESENNYEVAMGVAALLNGALQLKTSNTTTSIDMLPQLINVLNELIAQPDLKPETLDLLLVWCFKKPIIDNCSGDVLLEKHQQAQPDNLHVYLKSLQLAVERNNQGLGLRMLKQMSQAKINHRTINTTEAFNQTVDKYIENNPFPDSYLNSLTASKTDNGKSNRAVTQNFAKTAIKTAYAMFYEAPDLRPLFFLCKSNTALLQQCLNITNTLIKDSNTITAIGQGYAILMGIYENIDDKELFDVVKTNQEKFRDQVQCLSKATQAPDNVAEFFESEYQEIQLKNISELAKLKALAEYIYNKYKDSHPNQINPDSCDSKK